MIAHTPGPWKTVFANNCARVERDTAAMDRHIATVYGPDAADAFSHADLLTANARLIAAAPELAEALRKVHAMLDRIYFTTVTADDHVSQARSIISAALAKAGL